MKKILYLLAALILCHCADARTRSKAVPPSKFRTQLTAIIKTVQDPEGFELLKHTELVTGIWTCNRELQGFLPTIIYDSHPAGRLYMKAESVNANAAANVRMLAIKGIPGYTMRDSDNDNTVELDRTKESRKLIFTKRQGFYESTITVVYNAHRYQSLTMNIESLVLRTSS